MVSFVDSHRAEYGVEQQDVIFVDETDPISSPMKAKGVGGLGICGAAAAVANAIYNATGVRMRDYPFMLDKLIVGMPQAVLLFGDSRALRLGHLEACRRTTRNPSIDVLRT